MRDLQRKDGGLGFARFNSINLYIKGLCCQRMSKVKLAEIVETFEQMIENIQGLQTEIVKQLLGETLGELKSIQRSLDAEPARQSVPVPQQQRDVDQQSAMAHLEAEVNRLRKESELQQLTIKQLNKQSAEQLQAFEGKIGALLEQQRTTMLNLKQSYLDLASQQEICKQKDEIIKSEKEIAKKLQSDLKLLSGQISQARALEQNYLDNKKMETYHLDEIRELKLQMQAMEEDYREMVMKQKLEFERQQQELITSKETEYETHLQEQMQQIQNEFEAFANEKLDGLQQQIKGLQRDLQAKTRLLEERAIQIQKLEMMIEKNALEAKDKSGHQSQLKLIESKFKKQLDDYQEEFQNLKQLIADQCEVNKQNQLKSQEQDEVVQQQKQVIEDYIEQFGNHAQEKKALNREIEKLKIINEGLQDQLQNLNASQMGALDQLNKELRYQKTLVKQIEQENLQFATTLKACDLQKQELNEQIKQYEIILRGKEETFAELHHQISQLERLNFSLQQECQEEQQNLNLKVGQLQEIKKRQQQQLESQQVQIKGLQAEIKQISEQLEEANDNVAQMEILEQQQQQCIQFQNDKIDRLEHQIRLCKQQVHSLKIPSQSYRESYKTPEKELIESLEQRLQSKTKEIQRLQDMYQKVIEENEELSSMSQSHDVRSKGPEKSAYNLLESEVIENPEQERMKLQTIIRNIQKKTHKNH